MSRHLDQQHRAPLRCLLVGLLAAAAAPLAVAQSVAKPVAAAWPAPAARLALNELEYLEMPGLNVMLAHDYYPEGHQGGVGIIQNGWRVATNGDLRLDRTPGQWQPVPKVIGKRVVDRVTGEISVRLEYPDESKNRKGFNPVDYPDLRFAYTVRVRPEGQAFRILVDLDAPLPDAWIGKVGFNMELFPGLLFGKTFATEAQSGIFPRQANGPGAVEGSGGYQPAALAKGRRLVIAPESDSQRLVIEDANGGGLELVDGRGEHNNGWFVVRSLVAKGAAKGAVDWLVTPHAIPGWKSEPVVQVSQVGYHPKQRKFAVVELDKSETQRLPVVLSRVSETGGLEKVLEQTPADWGRFLRYQYLRFDFSSVERPGMYVVSYGDARSNPFRIGADVFARGVWQPTLEYFLPIQMCHVRVNEKYRVWHGAVPPRRRAHGAGLAQPLRRLPAGPSTLTPFLSRRAGARAEPRRLARRRRRRPARRVAGGHDARPRARLGGVPPRLRRDERRRGEPRRRDPPAGRQARRAAADRARRAHGRRRLPRARPLLPRHHRPTLRQYTHLGDFAAQTDGSSFDPRTAAAQPPAVGAGVPARRTIAGCSPRRTRGASSTLPPGSPPRPRAGATTTRSRPSA